MSKNTVRLVADFVEANRDQLIAWRRAFHQIPEISYKEYETQSYVLAELQKIEQQSTNPFSVTTLRTGVICDIGTGSPTIVYRINMDGLGIEERNRSEYVSRSPGFSHACGHDFELAIGLLSAHFYSKVSFAGTVRFVFQPAEEDCGNDEKMRTGGKLYLDEGVFTGDGALSLHVDPDTQVGSISAKPGIATANAFDFTFVVQGKIAHASRPHEGINPIPIASEVALAVEQLNEICKPTSTDEHLVVQITKIISGYELDGSVFAGLNTIPERCTVAGTLRTRGERLQGIVLNQLAAIADALSTKAQVEFTAVERAVQTVNSLMITSLVQESAEELGYGVIERITNWRDDAGYCSQAIPTCHYFVGVGKEAGQLHAPNFSPTEHALRIGAEVLLLSMQKFLHSKLAAKPVLALCQA